AGSTRARTALLGGAVGIVALAEYWYFERRSNHQVRLSPNEIAFGYVAVGHEVAASICISNYTKQAVIINSITAPELFRVSSEQPLPFVIPPGGVVILRVAFHPASVGTFKEQVHVRLYGNNKSGSRQTLVVNLTGIGTVALDTNRLVNRDDFTRTLGLMPPACERIEADRRHHA